MEPPRPLCWIHGEADHRPEPLRAADTPTAEVEEMTQVSWKWQEKEVADAALGDGMQEMRAGIEDGIALATRMQGCEHALPGKTEGLFLISTART